MLDELRRRPLYWLLAALPVAVALEWSHAEGLWIFLVSGAAIIPLAALMGRATENLAETLGAGIGGLLNATFGNAAEVIIALVALWKGPEMYDLVKASITGSIIGNALLVLGLAILAGGLKYHRQSFNRTAASMNATLLALAAIGLLIPTLYWYVFRAGVELVDAERATIRSLSLEIAVILAAAYGLSLLFALRTHHDFLSGEPAADLSHAGAAQAAAAKHAPEWGRATAVSVLVVATAGVAWMSELLVGSVGPACEALGMSGVFVGVIVVAVIGNAAEHATAVFVAMKNKMDLSVNIAVGSSTQVALFVAPLLVFASLLTGHGMLDLHFSPMETIAVVLSIGILYMVSQDGETHWLEGAMLLAVYIILGLAFYHLPADPMTATY